MKILLATHNFFPGHAAGTEVLTYSVAKELIRLGHCVRIFTGHAAVNEFDDDQRFDEYVFEGIHVYRFHHSLAPMGEQNSLIEMDLDCHLASTYFDKVLLEYQPDKVHFFHLKRLGSKLIEQAAAVKIPVFMTPTDFWAICPMVQLMLPDGQMCTGPTTYAGNCVKHLAMITKKGIAHTFIQGIPVSWFEKTGNFLAHKQESKSNYIKEVKALSNRLNINIKRFNMLNKIVVPTQLMHEMLKNNGVNPEKMILSSYGIDTISDSFSKVRKHSDTLKIGFIGTLTLNKGCHVLIDAFKMLPVGTATLSIYGARSERFIEYANSLEVRADHNEAISFRGTFEPSDISRILANFDVLVVPSIWYENAPLVVYSAQANRCPVIASNFPGLSETIRHGENGLLFEPGDARNLALQLSRLINEGDILENLSRAAKAPKSIKHYVEELLNIWTS